MRLDCRPTLPELEPAFLAYSGEALRPFLESRHLTPDQLLECAERAIERHDREGARLARALLRLTTRQRQRLRRALQAPG